MNIQKKYVFNYDYVGMSGYVDDYTSVLINDIDVNLRLSDFFKESEEELYNTEKTAIDEIYESYYNQYGSYRLYDFKLNFSEIKIYLYLEIEVEFINNKDEKIEISRDIECNICQYTAEDLNLMNLKLSDLKNEILNNKKIQNYILKSNCYNFKEIIKFNIK